MSQSKNIHESERFDALMAEAAKTRALDRRDVREGRISPQALCWFSREYVQSLRLVFPDPNEGIFQNKDVPKGRRAQRGR